MTQSNAVATSNITIIPPRPDNLTEAIEALHTAQITGEYRYTALGMAGALISEIGQIFPFHMALVYMASTSKRRQTWHSYIAAMFANPADPQPITDPDAVREKLMNTSSKELVQEAYGSVPSGFLIGMVSGSISATTLSQRKSLLIGMDNFMAKQLISIQVETNTWKRCM